MPATLSESGIKLLARLRRREKEAAQSGEVLGRIHVSNITAGLGFLYERVRNSLDYKEEPLWAKNAILRILRRREMQILAGEEIGLFLIQELIRGRYLENGSVAGSKILKVDTILAKYREVWFSAFPEGLVSTKKDRVYANWLLGIAASEIEEALRWAEHNVIYFQFLYESLRERIDFPFDLDKETSNLQLYLSVFRSFFQADRDMESWMLWKIVLPHWTQEISQTEIVKIGSEIASIYDRFEALLTWPMRKELDHLVKRHNVLTKLLSALLQKNLDGAEDLLADPERLESGLREVYAKYYKENRQRLDRTAFRAILFIAIAKLLMLFMEIPYAKMEFGEINLYILALSTILPPLILTVVSVSIRMPDEEVNFSKLLVEFNRLLSPEDSKLIVLKVHQPRTLTTKIAIGVVYIANFALTFGILFWIARGLGFSLMSAIIFIFFMCLVSFFAIRLRKTANELAVVEEPEHWARQIFDFLVFPIMEVGRMMSWALRSFNAPALLFDFLIEAPFNTFIGLIEEWFSFLRERKELS